MTDDKLDTPYIGAFKMVNLKNITIELSLPDTKIFPKLHASLIKKTLPDTPLTTTWNYSIKEKYEIEKILQKKKGVTKSRVLGEMEELQHFRSHMGTKSPFGERSKNLQTIPKSDIRGRMLRLQF